MNTEIKQDSRELELQIVRLLEDFYRKHEIIPSIETGSQYAQTRCTTYHTGFFAIVTLKP